MYYNIYDLYFTICTIHIRVHIAPKYFIHSMKIINIKDTTIDKMQSSLFTRRVTRQSPVKDDEGSDLSVDYIHFPKNVRNKFHKHSNDQVLILTSAN